MRSLHPPAPAKTAYDFFFLKKRVEIHRGVQSRAGFLLSPVDFITCASPTPSGLQAPSPAKPRHGDGGRRGKRERLQSQRGLATALCRASALSHPLPWQKLLQQQCRQTASPRAVLLEQTSRVSLPQFPQERRCCHCQTPCSGVLWDEQRVPDLPDYLPQKKKSLH